MCRGKFGTGSAEEHNEHLIAVVVDAIDVDDDSEGNLGQKVCAGLVGWESLLLLISKM